MHFESTLFETAHILHWSCCENIEITQHRLTYQSILYYLARFYSKLTLSTLTAN